MKSIFFRTTSEKYRHHFNVERAKCSQYSNLPNVPKTEYN